MRSGEGLASANSAASLRLPTVGAGAVVCDAATVGGRVVAVGGAKVSMAGAGGCSCGVSVASVVAGPAADIALSVEKARALLLVLGATRETIYECVLWRQAVDEAGGLVYRH